ncbi:MAG: PilZ domain-containing protein [Deltaproteobacteria bacterium]|nr:PilZ domain-containing protein [Deltaproteobacteria bacterium]
MTQHEKRLDHRRELGIFLNKYIGDEPYMVRAADISTSGIYLHKLIEPDLPDGSIVSLEFQLPGSEEVIWARGAVMRETRRWGADGVGVWFTILPQAYRHMIEDYIALN